MPFRKISKRGRRQRRRLRGKGTGGEEDRRVRSAEMQARRRRLMLSVKVLLVPAKYYKNGCTDNGCYGNIDEEGSGSFLICDCFYL